MYMNLVILTAFTFIYALVCGKLERTIFSGALVYLVFGIVVSPLGFGWLQLGMNADGIRVLAELTLALVLFTDAAAADLGALKRDSRIPQRLLLVGLPLTILLGIAAGFILHGSLGLLGIAVLATMLAPTDAALGKAVVTNKSVPARFREGLNVESGLNDGICVPILYVFLALATEAGRHEVGSGLAVKLLLEEIGIGAVAGLGVTYISVKLLRLCTRQGWVTEAWHRVPVIAMALLCFATAQVLGGSGFIASFLGGMMFGAMAKRGKHTLLLAAENTGDVMALLTWVVFGAAVIRHSLGHLTWPVLLYSFLSLTVVRMLPVFISLTGLGLTYRDKLFLGWFGPRGLASIVFAVIVLHHDLPGGITLSMTVICTVLLSIVAHGLSARPLVAAYDPDRAGEKKRDAPQQDS